MSLLRRHRADLLALGLLVILWAIFFWRLFTPVAADQASFKQGDFSGQFVAFGAYQHERWRAGEVPLWNPYNNGGLPFIADTQAAVFYPPRLLTIALTPEWSYNALQMEAVAHVLLLSVLMYVFVRRLTLAAEASVLGAFVAASVVSYGGFTAGYPPLQLALLEASVWLPLAALALTEATREPWRWGWLMLAGWALGMSWLAGHPQTSFFLTYLLVAYLAYRVYLAGMSWRRFLGALIVFGAVTLGVTAVTFLPGVEYLLLATRAELGFDAKGNGFPVQDVAQFVFPGVVSLFSPLYVGLPALMLAFSAVWRRLPGAWFWAGVALIALVHSFGANTAFYHAVYNVVPGLRFFRGQERAAYLVAHSLAILAGIGLAYLPTLTASAKRALRAFAGGIFGFASVTALLFFVGWLGGLGEGFGAHVGTIFFSALMAGLTLALIVALTQAPQRRLALIALAGLIVFELFSVNLDAESNYDPIPASEQLAMTPPPLVQAVLNDAPDDPYRVDGFRGLRDNYGSLYHVMDMRGISPLFTAGPAEIIYRHYTDNPLAWELFAVRYVFSGADALSVPTALIATGRDHQGTVYLHRLENPRPFAHLVFQADVIDSDTFAYALLSDPRYQPRQAVILPREPDVNLPADAPARSEARVTSFAPERIVIHVDTPTDAILTLAHPDYPGWRATLNGEEVPILRAYGALSALEIPAGAHALELVYEPLSYRLGAALSLVTWGLLVLLTLIGIFRVGAPKPDHR